MSRLGLVAHLEAMRANGMGIENIQGDDCAGASSAALRVWEDSNFPYRCDNLPVGTAGGSLHTLPATTAQMIGAQTFDGTAFASIFLRGP